MAETNASGAAVQINTYDEYGMPGSGNTSRFGYTGQMWIAEIGLYHYRNRVYNPRIGRFMQTDPIGQAGGINLYAYVGNDPVNYTDPWGLSSKQICQTVLWTYSGQPVRDSSGRIIGREPGSKLISTIDVCHEFNISDPFKDAPFGTIGGGAGGEKSQEGEEECRTITDDEAFQTPEGSFERAILSAGNGVVSMHSLGTRQGRVDINPSRAGSSPYYAHLGADPYASLVVQGLTGDYGRGSPTLWPGADHAIKGGFLFGRGEALVIYGGANYRISNTNMAASAARLGVNSIWIGGVFSARQIWSRKGGQCE